MNKKNIWMEKQNKPTLIVKDIINKYPEVDSNFIYEVLLKRGVFKWLSVRRDLIKYKDILKNKIIKLNRKKNIKEKGYMAALEECRAHIRKLCHSDRWIAPDFDKKANEFLSYIENK
jgi:hypothetical protein